MTTNTGNSSLELLATCLQYTRLVVYEKGQIHSELTIDIMHRCHESRSMKFDFKFIIHEEFYVETSRLHQLALAHLQTYKQNSRHFHPTKENVSPAYVFSSPFFPTILSPNNWWRMPLSIDISRQHDRLQYYTTTTWYLLEHSVYY